MAITATQIQFRLTVPTETIGDNSPQADPNASLGGFAATTTILAATLNNLFDDVSGDDNAAEDEEYRAFFVHNSNQTLVWETVKVWISATIAGGALASIALDTNGTFPVDHNASQMKVILTEDTVPAGASFTHPITKVGGLSIGSMSPLSVQGVWVHRTAKDTAALNNDGLTISFEGDTAA